MKRMQNTRGKRMSEHKDDFNAEMEREMDTVESDEAENG